MHRSNTTVQSGRSVAVDSVAGECRAVGGRADATCGRRPLRLRWGSLCSGRTCSKYLADGPQIGDIAFLGSACDLVEPAHRGRLETRFGWICGGIHHHDLYLDGVLTAMHPALMLFPPFLHVCCSA